MSKYTTEVRFICEEYAGLTQSEGQTSVNQIIETAAPKIFNFDFPIFDESNRLPLEVKILKHYYTREIGLETVGLWQLKLDMKMNEIMPIANELYKALAQDFNILDDVNYKREIGREETRNQWSSENRKEERNLTESISDKNVIDESISGTGSGETQNISKYSATPQGGLDGLMSDEYLTEATVDSNTVSNTQSNQRDYTDTRNESKSDTGNITHDNVGHTGMNGNDSTLEWVHGKMNSGKTYAQVFQEYKEAMINVDMMVIESLSELFMNLW